MIKKEKRKMNWKEKLNGKSIIVVIFTIVLSFILGVLWKFDWDQINSYQTYNTETLSYAKAKVISIEAETLEKDEMDDTRYLGTQDIIVEILEGEFKGEQISIRNYLSRTLNVYVKENQRIIVRVDAPENTEPYFSVYSYDRANAIWLLAVLFLVIMFLVGGAKGLRAVVGLLITMGYIFLFLLPAIYHGFPVWQVTIFTLALITVAAIFILNGIQKKTGLAILGTLSGILIAGICCMFCQNILHVSGYNLEDMEALVLVSGSTGLEIKPLLFVMVLISSLGAVMDVAVSVVSALWEVYQANQKLSSRQLFQSGINVGKDMIGTMSNTLILAFTGTALTTMFLLIAYGYQPAQLLSSDYIALELVQAVSSTFAVVLTVPAASLIGAIGIKEDLFKKNEKRGNV